MTQATETLTFDLQINAGQAEQQLAKTRGAAQSLGGSVGGLTKGLESLDKAEREASKALRGMSGAMGGLSNTVIGAIGPLGDMAGLLSSGGALGIALASAAAGVAWLTKKWEEELAAQDKAFEKQYEQFDAVNAKTKELEKSVAELRLQLNPADAKTIFAQAQADADALQPRIDKLRETLRTTFNAADRVPLAGELKQLERQQSLLGTQANLKIAALGKGKASAPKAAAQPGFSDDTDEAMERLARQLKAADQWINEQEKRDADRINGQIDAERKAHEERARIAQEANDKIAESNRNMWSDISSVALSSAIGGAMDAFDALMSGQEDALAKWTAGFLKSTGTQIIGIGTKYIMEGIGMNTVVPGSGAAALSAGIGITAVGVGMGGIGSALGGAMNAADKRNTERASAQGDFASRTDRGTGGRMRSSGRASGDGGINITVNYGVGGPPAEDTARAVSQAIARARRRGFDGPRGRHA